MFVTTASTENAKMYNCGCNFVEGGETKVIPKIVRFSKKHLTTQSHYTKKSRNPHIVRHGVRPRTRSLAICDLVQGVPSYICMCMYIYIYRERERYREREMYK